VKSSGEHPRATGGLVSNLPHPRINNTNKATHTHMCTHLPNGSIVFDLVLSVFAKVAVKIPPLKIPLQCLSPVSRASPFEDIACDMFEPRVRTICLLRVGTLVWLSVHVSTQAVAGTCTHLASYSVGAQLSPQAHEVSAVSDTAKCASLAACMHKRFQRCFGSQPSIIQHTSGVGFIPLLLPPCMCGVSLGSSRLECF